MNDGIQYIKSVYDHEAQARYIRISSGSVARTVSVSEDCNVDLTDTGTVIGFELLGKSAMADAAERADFSTALTHTSFLRESSPYEFNVHSEVAASR